MRPRHGGQVRALWDRGKRGSCQGESALWDRGVRSWGGPGGSWGCPSRGMGRMGTPIWVAGGLRGRRGQLPGRAGRAVSGGSWAKKCSILFHFVPFPIWGLGRLGTDLGGFDTRMGRNGTHLGRNGTPVWALEAAAGRGYLPGRGAAHGEIIARACASGQAEVGHVGRVAVREPQPLRQAQESLSLHSL